MAKLLANILLPASKEDILASPIGNLVDDYTYSTSDYNSIWTLYLKNGLVIRSNFNHQSNTIRYHTVYVGYKDISNQDTWAYSIKDVAGSSTNTYMDSEYMAFTVYITKNDNLLINIGGRKKGYSINSSYYTHGVIRGVNIVYNSATKYAAVMPHIKFGNPMNESTLDNSDVVASFFKNSDYISKGSVINLATKKYAPLSMSSSAYNDPVRFPDSMYPTLTTANIGNDVTGCYYLISGLTQFGTLSDGEKDVFVGIYLGVDE